MLFFILSKSALPICSGTLSLAANLMPWNASAAIATSSMALPTAPVRAALMGVLMLNRLLRRLQTTLVRFVPVRLPSPTMATLPKVAMAAMFRGHHD
jgi:hypothetical protein